MVHSYAIKNTYMQSPGSRYNSWTFYFLDTQSIWGSIFSSQVARMPLLNPSPRRPDYSSIHRLQIHHKSLSPCIHDGVPTQPGRMWLGWIRIFVCKKVSSYQQHQLITWHSGLLYRSLLPQTYTVVVILRQQKRKHQNTLWLSTNLCRCQ